jgi:hypothetical protein
MVTDHTDDGERRHDKVLGPAVTEADASTPPPGWR